MDWVHPNRVYQEYSGFHSVRPEHGYLVALHVELEAFSLPIALLAEMSYFPTASLQSLKKKVRSS